MDPQTPRAHDEPAPSHEVKFLPTPPEAGRNEALKERRENARALAAAVKQIKELEVKAYRDEMTGVYNRNAFDEQFPKLVEIAHENHEPLGLIFADIDGLKRTNDKYGHDMGDEAIKAGADALTEVSRPGDLVARRGGDELFIIMPGFTPNEGQSAAELVAETKSRFAKVAQSKIDALGIAAEDHVGVSFSLVIKNENESPEAFLKRADEEMYAAKEARRAQLLAEGFAPPADDRLAS